MHPDLKLAIRLQELDLELSRLAAEIAEFPKHIAQIEKKLDSGQRKLEADRAALSANQRDRKKLEGEIQAQEQKISKLRDQMLQVKTNEQYRVFQSEIEYCEKEIRHCEDRILDLMTESEPLDRNVKVAEEALKGEKAKVEAEKAVARERTDKDRAQVARLKSERNALARQMAPAIFNNYERLRKSRRGVAVAEVVDGRCMACQIAVRLQFLQDLKRGDEVMPCESCGRLLYYNPPVAIEDLTGEPASTADQT